MPEVIGRAAPCVAAVPEVKDSRVERTVVERIVISQKANWKSVDVDESCNTALYSLKEMASASHSDQRVWR